MQNMKQNLADAVHEARTECELSQEKLAEAVNMDTRTILKILKQDVAIQNLKSCIPLRCYWFSYQYCFVPYF